MKLNASWPSTPVIDVMGEEEIVHIGYDAVAVYHGQAALAMLAITFQGLRLLLHALSPQHPPRRAELFVLSGHPGPGVRDAFEFVTRAATRNAYTVDRSLPDARLCPHLDLSYSYRVTLARRTAGAALRAGVLPDRFFDLVSLGSRRSALEAVELSALKRQISSDALKADPEALFALI